MKLTHPNAPGVVIEPKAEHAATYTTQGWVEVDEKSTDDKPKGK